MELDIPEFDFSKVLDNRNFMIIGRRGSGKSSLLHSILYELNFHKKFYVGCAMCPTVNTIAMLKTHVPDALVYEDGCEEDCLVEVVDTFKELVKKESGKNKNGLIVFDDCGYDKKAFKTKTMVDLSMNGRQYNITSINCTQYVMSCGTEVRSQQDYVIVFKDNIAKNRRKLWEEYFGIFETYQEFAKVIKFATKNWGALVLDNTSPRSELSECLFWIKAKENVPEFKIGKNVFWKLSDLFIASKSKRRECDKQSVLASVKSIKSIKPATVRKLADKKVVIESIRLV